MAVPQPELTDPEDKKLLTLARSARARTRAAQGAALRDLDGRTYAAGAVSLPSLHLSAVQVAVAMAVTSGARGVEALVVTGDQPSDSDRAVLRDLGGEAVSGASGVTRDTPPLPVTTVLGR